MATRPKHLNLFVIKLPIPGIMSIMHRVSGFVLFLALPVFLYWFQLSLISPATFAKLKDIFSNPLCKIIALALMWGYFHHLCAGTRHIFLDLGKGLDLPAARLTAKLAIAGGVILTVLMGVIIW
jgi:succinate dehydrogenase / fumarate reductase cytochrome b subunit